MKGLIETVLILMIADFELSMANIERQTNKRQTLEERGGESLIRGKKPYGIDANKQAQAWSSVTF